jgi:hypothetical protein
MLELVAGMHCACSDYAKTVWLRPDGNPQVRSAGMMDV